MPTKLTREYRFYLRPSGKYERAPNAWSGAESGMEIAPFLMLRATVTGQVDPQSGYLINIQEIDRALAKLVAARVASSESNRSNYFRLLQQTIHLPDLLPPGVRLLQTELVVSPHLSLKLNLEESVSVSLTQEFEFSAAHRLHCESMSAEGNREYFGKCNNPNGHGHNYVVAVTVACQDEHFSLPHFEALVKRHVIDHLDHKHLNLDVPEFADLNPSVENIAAVVWRLLKRTPNPPTLQNVRVYETPKTWADYWE
jgi:6-pyruvoyltetrahydropterin/6-carboxytetrahydropterin synthase